MIQLTGTYGKRLTLFFLIYLFELFFTASGIASTGVLLMVKGEVSVISKGKQAPAQSGLKLTAGDTVKSMGGTATVLLSDGRLKKIKKDQQLSFSAGQSEGKKELLVSRLFNTIKETSEIGRGPTVKGMVRGRDDALIKAPHNSFVLLNALRFQWEIPEGAENIVVSLKSRRPKFNYSFEVASGADHTFVPKDAPLLIPDVRYYWKVEGFNRASDEAFSTKLGWFSILDALAGERLNKELAEIDQMAGLDPFSAVYLKATLYIDYKLYHDAEKLLKNYLGNHPDNESIKDLLSGVYIKMKKFDKAEALQAK